VRKRKHFLVALVSIATVSGVVALAQGRGGFAPVNWKPGQDIHPKNGAVSVSAAKIGPPNWSYAVEAGPCPRCGGGVSVMSEVEEVSIVSNFVPVQCGNTATVKDISTSTAGWKTSPTGEVLVGPRPGSKGMEFDINCDAKNGPIYLRITVVYPAEGNKRETLSVGPLPGPVDPQ
jgi:hypothetical protein